MNGYDRLHPRYDIREPISIEMMEQMPHALSHVCFSKYEETLFLAAFSLAFSAFLRVGELTVKSSKEFDHVLSKHDVLIDTSRRTVFVTVRFSKTDQMGLTSTLAIDQNRNLVGLIDTLQQYISIRPNVQGPFFCHLNGKPITRYQFHSILKSALRFLNYDVNKFNTHSFRIGAATFAFLNGNSESEIKDMGRWRSSTYKRYIRINTRN